MEEERGHDAAVPFIEVLQPCPPRGGGQEEEVGCLCGGACVRVCMFGVKRSSSCSPVTMDPTWYIYMYKYDCMWGKERHRRQTGE